ncbi:MAG TPA: hypothetical protein VNX70_18290 [Bryobacteraceae bacterium]|nr:hypothetical protein [Bryobacteraceae bacterium]
MKRLIACSLLTALLLGAAEWPLFSEIGTIEQGLSEITGLRFTRHVPYALINKQQLRRYLEDRIKEIKPADIRAEELTLKLLGLIPPDFDLRQNTVDLLTEQAAAFYDYNKRKLFVLEGSDAGSEERMVLVHELAHALADQHFPLRKYIREGSQSDDGSTARLAVMEGQATWLMAAYLSKLGGGQAEVPDSVLQLMTNTVDSSPGQYPVFSQAPPYIRDSLVFPYNEGMLFQNAVFKKLGREAFSEVFRHPPVSTQQVLHPDRYLSHSAPGMPDSPAVPAPHQVHELGDGSLGEFDFRVLLSQYTTKEEGEQAATHLTGGSYALFEYKHDKLPLLAFASTWDSQESAGKYLELYSRVLQGKWKKLEIASQTAAEITGHGDTGYFRAWKEGASVYHLEGLKSLIQGPQSPVH